MNEFDFSVLTAGEPAQFGKYGSLRLRYLKENKPTLYQALLQGHLLNAHLNEIDQQAHEVVEQIAQQLIRSEQFDESVKPSNLMLSDKVLRIEFSDSISKTYVLYTLRTPFVRAQLSAAASGTSESMKNISQNAIKGLLIPFPPIKEQYRIVSKVEESLSKIKTL